MGVALDLKPSYHLMVPPNNANREPAPRETKGRKAGNVRIAGQGYLNASSVEKTTAYLTPLCGGSWGWPKAFDWSGCCQQMHTRLRETP
jgi:hypothetical protein